MRNIRNTVGVLALAAFVVGCAGLYKTTVTITQVVDAGMKDWAAASVAGKTTAAIDVKVIAAHEQYRKACAVAQAALIAYKNTGDQTQYVAALTAVRTLASGIFDLITPFLAPSRAQELNVKLSKATNL